jgi:hypothetical protein
MHHYISCVAEEDETTAEKTTKLLLTNVWKLHELSSIIISNRNSQFVSLVWKTVCKILKIDVKFSIAFHLEIDDQSELANQEMKRYLRSYCNYQQDDWSKWIVMIEFASNATTFVFIELSAFMINYDFESRMSFDSFDLNDDVYRERSSAKERVLTQKANIIAKKMRDIWDFIKKKLANAQDNQKKYADQKRKFSSEYKVENMIWLFTKNIKTERSFKKLDHKWIESFKIKEILENACRLDLSSSMKIHDIFHTSLLRMIATNSFTEQIQLWSSSVVMNEEEEYEIDDILNSRYHYDKLQYKIAWTDHFSNRAWYSAENFQNHSKEIVDDYHQRYLIKFESNLRLIVIIEAMLSQWIRDDH